MSAGKVRDPVRSRKAARFKITTEILEWSLRDHGGDDRAHWL